MKTYDFNLTNYAIIIATMPYENLLAEKRKLSGSNYQPFDLPASDCLKIVNDRLGMLLFENTLLNCYKNKISNN